VTFENNGLLIVKRRIEMSLKQAVKDVMHPEGVVKDAIEELKQIERKLKKPRYMMATKAIHKLGDISRDVPDLCYVHSEDEENYIGNWTAGFGFINVKFPKKTTRELTEKEKERYNGTQIIVGSNIHHIIETKENPIPVDAMKVATKNSVYHFGKANKKGVRTISRDEKPLDFKEGVITFLVIGKSMQFCPVDNPGILTTSKVLSIE